MAGLNHTVSHVCIHADYGNPFKASPAGSDICMDDVIKKIIDHYLRFKTEDVVLPENGFEYILFVKIANNTASS